MKVRQLQGLAAAAACMCMLAAPALAAPTGQAAAHPSDVALAAGGELVGQLVDAQGAPLANAPVSIQSQGREVVQATTDAQGQFRITGLKGGVYEIVAPGHYQAYRFWAPRTAPPAATAGVLMVADGDLARAQYGAGAPCAPCKPGPFGTAMGWVAQHPLLTAGIVAAAIAIPLAIDDDDPAS
ncbi:MAG: carboxypeptidase regulatory-like domain-containing protein [Planctomycetales bacterium]|nr:carboxypeptidase regulatory-like domain-containing protein [Planctomycetales bacterium]